MGEYYVYITTNITKTVLYIGVTGNFSERLSQHLQAENKRSFTAKYAVNRLIYFERFQDIRYAIAREKEIKKWRREKKNRLVETINPYWKFLDEEW